MNTNTENAVVVEAELNEFDTLKGLKFSIESFRALIEIVQAQNERIQKLESKNQTSSTKREMTTEDAVKVMIGELRNKSHNECVKILGLTYGQVYSARLGHTFKPVTKQMKEGGLADIWTKAK